MCYNNCVADVGQEACEQGCYFFIVGKDLPYQYKNDEVIIVGENIYNKELADDLATEVPTYVSPNTYWWSCPQYFGCNQSFGDSYPYISRPGGVLNAQDKTSSNEYTSLGEQGFLTTPEN
jgi:hypothetical protein